MNKEFVAELRVLLDKYDCYVSRRDEELAFRDNKTHRPLVSTNDVFGSPGGCLDSSDLEGLV